MPTPFSADELSALLGQQQTRKRGLLTRIFQCSCAVGGAAGLAHIGCIATPLSMTIAASSPALASLLPSISDHMMIGMSALFSTAGLGTWWAMRGRKAGTMERSLTASGAAFGFAFTLAMHGMLPGVNFGNNHHRAELNDGSLVPHRFEDLDGPAREFARSLMVDANVPEEDAVRMATAICSQDPAKTNARVSRPQTDVTP